MCCITIFDVFISGISSIPVKKREVLSYILTIKSFNVGSWTWGENITKQHWKRWVPTKWSQSFFTAILLPSTLPFSPLLSISARVLDSTDSWCYSRPFNLTRATSCTIESLSRTALISHLPTADESYKQLNLFLFNESPVVAFLKFASYFAYCLNQLRKASGFSPSLWLWSHQNLWRPINQQS